MHRYNILAHNTLPLSLLTSSHPEEWPPRDKQYAYSYDDEDTDALQSKPVLADSPWTYQNGLNPNLAPTRSRQRHVKKGNEGWEVRHTSSPYDIDNYFTNERWTEVNGRLYKVYDEENEAEEDDYGYSDD